MLKKSTLSEREKEKWDKVLEVEVMSSEESNPEDDDVIAIKPLSWRSERVSQFLHRLDDKSEERKTTQAKRQRKNRVIGSVVSTRAKPSGNLPNWVFINEAPTAGIE